jgi:hypothetical protein
VRTLWFNVKLSFFIFSRQLSICFNVLLRGIQVKNCFLIAHSVDGNGAAFACGFHLLPITAVNCFLI